jgi:hypothetical protein
MESNKSKYKNIIGDIVIILFVVATSTLLITQVVINVLNLTN